MFKLCSNGVLATEPFRSTKSKGHRHLCRPTPKLSRFVQLISFCATCLALTRVEHTRARTGAGHITANGSTIGHSIADLLSKNLWGVFEWKLDNSLHAHSLALEAEDQVDEKGDPIIVRHSTTTYTPRATVPSP